METSTVNDVMKTELLAPPSIVPTTMTEAMQLANLMASAKLVPAALQKSPADCLLVITQAIRWNMDAFAVAQECSVIQGKLMHSGKLVAAVINARGNLAQRLAFDYQGEGDERVITVSGRLFGESEARTVTVKLKDARTQNRVWQTQPDQQLMYHGSRVWARRHAPELMLGVYSPEEFDEPAPLSPAAKRPRRPAPNVMLAPAEISDPPHDPETGEITESTIPPANTEPSPPADKVPASQSAVPAEVRVSPRSEAGTTVLSVEDMAREAATRGKQVFNVFYKSRTAAEKKQINTIGDELRALMDAAEEPAT
jgi:hypothetical protein